MRKKINTTPETNENQEMLQLSLNSAEEEGEGDQSVETEQDFTGAVITQKEESEGRIFLKMQLKGGVTPINVVAFYLGFFVTILQASLLTAFTLFLLEDNYGVEDSDAAKVLGNLGTVGDVAVVSTEFFIGYAMDLFGRKMLTISGLLLSGTATFCSPMPSDLTGLYFFRVMTVVGNVPMLNSPYVIDYVSKGSLGRA